MPVPREAALLHQRLRNEKLTHPEPLSPAEIVRWFGAVQAQDYPGARWALGLRNPALDDAAVQRAFDEGAIVRTHVMRPTWHFVAPADLRWMQALTGPRVRAGNHYYNRQAGLEPKVLARARAVMARALEGQRHLTRLELAAALQRARIPCQGQRLAYIVMDAEIEALICSGPRRGKQFTYALVDERIPPARPLDRESALAELARRYFASHGPATVRDMSWWSGLTMRDVKAGVLLAGPALVEETVDGLTYYSAADAPQVTRRAPGAWLLPNYDEFLIAFRDRGLSAPRTGPSPAAESIFAHQVVIDGCVAGSWQRTVKADRVELQVKPYAPFSRTETRLVAAAATGLSRFLRCPCVLLSSDE